MTHPERILVVDPEPRWVSLARQVLSDAGYAVTAANRGERAVELAAVEPPDLILLEARLPGELDGCQTLRRIRAFSDLPVILLSGVDEAETELRGFEAGADDYILKPYDPRILLARLAALLRRARGRVMEPAAIACGPLLLNQVSRRVSLDGLEIYLTETEYNLLLELARHRDQVLLHEQLLAAVWRADAHAEIDNLRAYIHILRRKLESNPASPRLILSRPGVGYMLVSQPPAVPTD